MSELRYTDDQIEDKILEFEELKGRNTITFQQLKSMSIDEVKELKSYTWKDGKRRCESIGITNVKIWPGELNNRRFWVVSYSDSNSDVQFHVDDLETKVHQIPYGPYSYGLYKKIN